MRNKKCKECGKLFIPTMPMAKVCGFDCALTYGKKQAEKVRRKDTKERLAKLKTRSDWLREAQTVFNRYIRARDAGMGCISCGRDTGAKMNAGHYLSIGAHPELRFCEDNVHAQCEHCNSYLSGNISKYRPKLIEKVGLTIVEKLEASNSPVKYSIEDIKEIKKRYTIKLAELTKATWLPTQ